MYFKTTNVATSATSRVIMAFALSHLRNRRLPGLPRIPMFDVGNDERIIAEQAWVGWSCGPDPVEPPANQSHRRLTTIEIVPRVGSLKFQQNQNQVSR
jgi:hypothetical protein